MATLGCSNRAGIVGVWELREMKSAEGNPLPITANTSLEFREDGTVISDAPIGSSRAAYQFDGVKLVITQQRSDALFPSSAPSGKPATDEAQVKIDGSTMTMTMASSSSSHGAILSFKRRP